MEDKDNPDGVILESFGSPTIASMVVEVLKGEGIPAYVKGDSLQDEFAISQRAMNVAGVQVYVHPHDLERARGILAAMREAGQELESKDEE